MFSIEIWTIDENDNPVFMKEVGPELTTYRPQSFVVESYFCTGK